MKDIKLILKKKKSISSHEHSLTYSLSIKRM